MKSKKLETSRITQLDELLGQSAFRHGTSAFRYGLLPVARPVIADITVEFAIMAESVVKEESSPRFFQQLVQRTVDPSVGQEASQLLGSSAPKLTSPVPILFNTGEN